MKKIKDGTYKAMRCDASGYVYGYYKSCGNFPNAPKGCFIQKFGEDIWITPVVKDTLRYRKNGKWIKL